MAHKRTKYIHCNRCGGDSAVTADLDEGKIDGIEITSKCIWPAQCPNEFVEGVFDRPFGSRIIQPKPGGYK